MAGVSENITPFKQATPVVLTQDVDPLSTQEMIDLVNGKAQEFCPSKQSVKKARVTPHPPVPLIPPHSSSSSSRTSKTSPGQQYRYQSESPFYRLDPGNPTVGDIVSTTISTVNTSYSNKVVSPNYLLIGRVKHFVNVLKSTRPNHPVDEWEEERLMVEWLTIEVLQEKRDVIIGPILPSKLTIVAKHNLPNLMGMNDFLIDYLHKNFYYDHTGGWKIIRNYVFERTVVEEV